MNEDPSDIIPQLHQIKLTTVPAGIRRVAAQIPFRQSMLSDYSGSAGCPQMMMYRWLFGFEESSTFFAAVMGSAGHKVVYDLHVEQQFNLSFSDLLGRFNIAFEEQLDKEKVLPKVSAKFDTLLEQRDALAGNYVDMLLGYMRHDLNKQFIATMHEQSFVLQIDVDDARKLGVTVEEHHRPFIFTGTIDQAGYYQDGTFVMRDLKFRDNAFKPSSMELNLNMQLTIYAYALRFGVPSCEGCKPKWLVEESEFMYDGPCSDCEKKIGTPLWPGQYAARAELIWMRDFIKHEKDEFTREIKDKTVKVPSAKSRRLVYADIINPKWLEGYKRGDYKGKAIYKTPRSPSFLTLQMSDVLRVAQQIRNGVFYRRPGSQCSFWCKHTEACLKGIELEMEEADIGEFSNFATLDPFGES